MNNKEFIAELSRRMGYKNEHTRQLLLNVFNNMGDNFMEGNPIYVSNFGTFEVKKKMERVMVSPTTGQRMLVPPKMVLSFKPYSGWKEKIKKGGES